MKHRYMAVLLAAALGVAACGSVDDDSGSSPPAEEPADESEADEPADDEPEAEESAAEEPADDRFGEPTGVFAVGPEDEVDSDGMADFPDDRRDPEADGWVPQECEPTNPGYAEPPSEPITQVADTEVFGEGLAVGEFTFRAFYVNTLNQVFSVYSSSNDDEQALNLFANRICLETLPSAEDLPAELFMDGVDSAGLYESVVTDLTREAEEVADAGTAGELGEQVEARAEAEEVAAAVLDDGAPDGLRTILIVPEFCDDLIPDEFLDRCDGNDALLDQPVVTHLFIDPRVGRGKTDRYSTKYASSVTTTVGSSRHRVYAAVRRAANYQTVSGGRVYQGYSRTLRAKPPIVGPVKLTVYGYWSNSSTAVYSVKSAWRSESYSK